MNPIGHPGYQPSTSSSSNRQPDLSARHAASGPYDRYDFDDTPPPLYPPLLSPPAPLDGSRTTLPVPLSDLHRRTYPTGSIPTIQIPANPYAGFRPVLSSRPLGTQGPLTATASGPVDFYSDTNGHLIASGISPSYLFASHPLSSGFKNFIDRDYRSPAPPLTATLQGAHLWPPPLPPVDFDRKPSANQLTRPYYSSPLDLPSIPAPSRPSYNGPTSPHAFHYPPFLSAPPPHIPSAITRHSPVYIPPPLRFNYSHSPPPGDLLDMPPRKRTAVAGLGSGLITPSSQASSSTSSRRKNLPGAGWTIENTYDSVGQKREVVVIDDSESPNHIPRKRTRAQAAAERAAANGHSAISVNTTASAAGSTKKRKIDTASDVGSIKKAKGKTSGTAASFPATQVAQKPRQPAAPPAASAASNATPWDDVEGHYIVKPDDIIGNDYKIIRLLGQGTFGKVVEARHIVSRRKVAIKIIRAVQKYREASKIECRVLDQLKKHDPMNENKCIHLETTFDFRSHPCLVSELYGMSVFDFLKQNAFQPFPERHIQDFARSLFTSVAYIHRLKLTHTDLKPENILLVSNEARLQGPRVRNAKSKSILRNTDIRLIDFGSATFEGEYHSSVVSTRHYRAPEIILGLPWSYPCDLFSIGCILVEFYTGEALFQTHDNLEHLAMMEIIMSKMPSRIIEKGRLKKPEFFRGLKIDYPNSSTSRGSRKYVKALRPLDQIIPPSSQHNRLFLDLIVRLLDFDPETRMTVHAALRHPYLKENIPEPV